MPLLGRMQPSPGGIAWTVSHHHLCPVVSLHVPITHGTPVGLGIAPMVVTDHPGPADGDPGGHSMLAYCIHSSNAVFVVVTIYFILFFI